MFVSRKQNRKSKRKRKRKRKRKKKQSSTGDWSSAPESFQIFYRLFGPDDDKAFSFTIPSDVLNPFSQVDVSCYHAHHHYHVTNDNNTNSLNLSPDHLSILPGFPDGVSIGNAAVVGSILYAMFLGELDKDSGVYGKGKLMSLNLDYAQGQSQQQWKQVASPPFLGLGIPSMTPKLVSLRSHLYFFGHIKPFGQVYDPHTNSWSLLHEPPGIVDSSKCSIGFRTSLGESHGKILLYGNDVARDDNTRRFHIYDVESDQWTSCSSTRPLDSALLADFRILGKAVAVEEDNTSTFLYFMDRRGLVFAFDWQNMEIFQGPIVGMELEAIDFISALKSRFASYTFFHIWGDLFCLLWSTHTLGYPSQYSFHHFTFLRIIKDSKPGHGSITAHVVGCLQDTVDGQYECYDALLV